MLEEYPDITVMKPLMASKAAIVRLFETLRVELAPDVNVTVVVLGFVDSEMTEGRQLSQDKEMEIRETTRDVSLIIWICLSFCHVLYMSMTPTVASPAIPSCCSQSQSLYGAK
ncbi:hypothetical protein Droror1_Dr00012553 [Drosera rotundifolia]